MTKDIIQKETELLSDSYVSRKGQVYLKLNTKSSDWKACEIIDFMTEGTFEIPIYKIPDNYTRAITEYTQDTGAFQFCNLCGHQIKISHYIQNDVACMYMLVGSECVNNHHGKVVKKKIKEFKDNKTRIQAKEFLRNIITWANTQKEFVTPKTYFEIERLTHDAFTVKHQAEKLLAKFENAGVKKLQNFMTKHQELLQQSPTTQDLSQVQISTLHTLLAAYETKTNLKISFGKYKDKNVLDVTEDYIEWAKQAEERQR